MSARVDTKADPAPSFAAPFHHPAFAVIWTATLVSNVGGWMYSAASAWLMTSLDPDPFRVALVQAASALPICLLALLALANRKKPAARTSVARRWRLCRA